MCPRCHSGLIRHSRTKGFLDRIMLLFEMRPYRCRECSKRFYVPKQMDLKYREVMEWRKRARVHIDLPL